jgi:hypothetical protein
MTLASALLLATMAATTDAPAAPAPPSAPVVPPAAPAAAATSAPKAKAASVKPLRPALPAASLPSVEGEILDADLRAHRLRIRAADGEVALTFDRNTLLRGPAGAITTLQLAPGARVKAGRDGETRAAWIELKPASSTPRATP